MVNKKAASTGPVASTGKTPLNKQPETKPAGPEEATSDGIGELHVAGGAAV